MEALEIGNGARKGVGKRGMGYKALNDTVLTPPTPPTECHSIVQPVHCSHVAVFQTQNNSSPPGSSLNVINIYVLLPGENQATLICGI